MVHPPIPEALSSSPRQPTKNPPALLGVPLAAPQLIAALLLLAFLGQCLVLVARRPLSDMELSYVRQGQAQLHGEKVFPGRAPLVALLAAVFLHGGPAVPEGPEATHFGEPGHRRWLARAPFLAIGVMLGASLWYVSRRLFGNTGGYLALTLYAFSPFMIQRAASVQPAMVGAWGAFGVIFTTIAVAHTLYAPREVVLWNWRRILLLGLAIGLAAGSQVALALLVPVALAFMLYLVPERRGAAVAILAASCVVALVVLWAAGGFSFAGLSAATGHLRWADFTPGVFGHGTTYLLLALFLLRAPALLVMLLAALAVYAAWPRARFFGSTAPLLVFVLLLALGLVLPHLGGFNFFLIALPFACVFVAGVFTDLLETRYSGLVLGAVLGVLLAHAAYSLGGLLRL
jgi:hypothetical protein